MVFLELGIADYVVRSGGVNDFSRSRVTKAQSGIGTAFSSLREGYWGEPFGDAQAVSHDSFFATRHMREYGTTSRQLGMISVQERQWARKIPEPASTAGL